MNLCLYIYIYIWCPFADHLPAPPRVGNSSAPAKRALSQTGTYSIVLAHSFAMFEL